MLLHLILYINARNNVLTTVSFVLSLRALSITNPKHSANKMHNAVPYIFILHHHKKHSHMFRSAMDHHHGTKPKHKRLISLYGVSRWFGSLMMTTMMVLDQKM